MKNTVFVPVPVEDRLPTKRGLYYALWKEGLTRVRMFYPDLNGFYDPSGSYPYPDDPDYWLEARKSNKINLPQDLI